jgi:6-phosphogluconate dehydrogenase (decarboxylating)
MKTTVGIIGLGKMDGNLALQAIEKRIYNNWYEQTP